MVKLDVDVLRYLSKEELRTLVAVEQGMKNHELVPSELVTAISGLKRGAAQKALSVLCKNKLVVHEGKYYDGFKLTYRGYDYLALRTLSSRGVIRSIGRQIGVGKESDIFVAEHLPSVDPQTAINTLPFVPFSSSTASTASTTSYSRTPVVPPAPPPIRVTNPLAFSEIELAPETRIGDSSPALNDAGSSSSDDDAESNEDSDDDEKNEKKQRVTKQESEAGLSALFLELASRGSTVMGAIPPEIVVLKFARLGRTSFRSIKNNRDYLEHRKSAGWLYMSRLAALKEFAYMRILYEHGFPVPRPIDVNRHCVVMQLIEGYPLCQVREMLHPGRVYAACMSLIVRLALCGLIHCDFNEFNLMVSPTEEVTMIDFPQMVSTSHPNAQEYFDRDVGCIRIFFKKQYKFEGTEWPSFAHVTQDLSKKKSLDVLVEASGFSKGDLSLLDQPLDQPTPEEPEAQPLVLPAVETLEDRIRRQMGISDLKTTADGVAVVEQFIPSTSTPPSSSSSSTPLDGPTEDKTGDAAHSSCSTTDSDEDSGEESSENDEEDGPKKKYSDKIGSRAKRRKAKKAAMQLKDPEYIKRRVKAAAAKKNKQRRGKTNSTKNREHRKLQGIVRDMT